jgi:hypothetical protein
MTEELDFKPYADYVPTGKEHWLNGTVVMSKGRLLAITCKGRLFVQTFRTKPLEEKMLIGRSFPIPDEDVPENVAFETMAPSIDNCQFAAIQDGEFIIEEPETEPVEVFIDIGEGFARAVVHFVNDTFEVMTLVKRAPKTTAERLLARRYIHLLVEPPAF